MIELVYFKYNYIYVLYFIDLIIIFNYIPTIKYYVVKLTTYHFYYYSNMLSFS